MQRQSNFYIFGFATLVTLFASVVLSLAATALKPMQNLNQKLDVVKNILSVAGYSDEKISSLRSKEVLELYRKRFESEILDKNNAAVDRKILEEQLASLGFAPESLAKMESFELIEIFNNKLSILARRAGKSTAEFDPGYKLVYLFRPEKRVEAYIIPVNGKGLWDMIYGYLALEPDLETVKGIRFYKHQETPGLGGEIEKPWFTKQFVGKTILDDQGNFTSVAIVKGDAELLYSGEALEHHVDGISGATITGKQVTKFLRSELLRYEPYFKTIRARAAGGEIEGGEE